MGGNPDHYRTIVMATETWRVKVAMERCRMPPTTWIAQLSCIIGAGLEVPDQFSGHVQQGKNREIALSFNSKLSQTSKW